MFSLSNIRLRGTELPWFWMSLFVNKSVYYVYHILFLLMKKRYLMDKMSCLKINCCRRDSKFSAISFSKRIFSVPQQWKWTHFQLRGTGGAALHTIVLSHGEGESRYQNETNTNILQHTYSQLDSCTTSIHDIIWLDLFK